MYDCHKDVFVCTLFSALIPSQAEDNYEQRRDSTESSLVFYNFRNTKETRPSDESANLTLYNEHLSNPPLLSVNLNANADVTWLNYSWNNAVAEGKKQRAHFWMTKQ